jgi:hypothetical protein
MGIFVIKNPHLESGLAPSPSLFQKHSLTGVTTFEVYVSDVMETIHPFSPQVASLYQRWLGKRLFSDKRM